MISTQPKHGGVPAALDGIYGGAELPTLPVSTRPPVTRAGADPSRGSCTLPRTDGPTDGRTRAPRPPHPLHTESHRARDVTRTTSRVRSPSNHCSPACARGAYRRLVAGLNRLAQFSRLAFALLSPSKFQSARSRPAGRGSGEGLLRHVRTT